YHPIPESLRGLGPLHQHRERPDRRNDATGREVNMAIDRMVPAISYRDFLDNLNTTRVRIERESRETSSGRRVTDPSDDPVSIAKLLQFKDNLAGIEQFGRNAASGKALLSFTDSVLDSVVNQMNVVIQRGTAAANGTQTVQSRSAIGDEIIAIRDQFLNLA